MNTYSHTRTYMPIFITAFSKLHLLLKKYLEGYGIKVITTRAEQTKDLEVYQRGLKAQNCDMFISLHSNACDSSKVNRVDVYASYDNLNNSHTFGKVLARKVAEVMGISESNVKTRKSEKGDFEYYGVLRGARSADCPLYYLIEHSFHTNEASARWLLDNKNLDKLAKAEAEAIAEHFGIEAKKAEENTFEDIFIGDNKMVTIEMPTIKNGSKCEEVKTLQTLLKARGYKGANKKVLSLDGDFGANTEYALKAYQANWNLTADGIAGAKTWKKILKG